MLQLVNDKVCALNPPKDNLICDATKVEEILGVKPEQVIDVMALRGDSIDNIPGAPGIGDKGSVEIIKRFGTLESALEHAAEVERKTYRESLLNNKETILWSKQLVTIDQNVGIELELEKMVAGDPDTDALRALFNELEFTTLLKELAPVVEVRETDYRELKSAAEVKELRRAKAPLAIAFEFTTLDKPEEEEPEGETEQKPEAMLFDAPPASSAETKAPLTLAISPATGKAFSAMLNGNEVSDELKRLLNDPKVPKTIHDYKDALRRLEPHGVELAGVNDEPMLYSYLINPTYSKHSLAEIAVRSFNLNLSASVAEAADVTGRITPVLRKEVESAGQMPLYEQIDLPLVAVLARMEQAGVKIDRGMLGHLSVDLEKQCDSKAKEIHAKAGVTFNINSPKQLGDVLFNQLNLPKPVKYGKGKMISTAVDVLEELAETR
jgi:DNA polymerase-1